MTESRPFSVRIRSWLENASFEMNVAEERKLERVSELLPASSKIFVVHLHGKDFRLNIRFCEKLMKFGLVPVPHLAARNFSGRTELDNALADLRRNGVEQLLVLGGGIKNSKSPFFRAMDILRSDGFLKQGFKRVALAGHPEPHPEASDERIWQGYAQKIAFLNQSNVETSLVTQFTFSVQSLLDFAVRLRENGLNVTVQAGVAGRCGFANLIRYSAFCGIGNSLKVLRKEAANLGNLARGFRSASFLLPFFDEIEKRGEGREEISGSFDGIHVFPFGNVADSIIDLRKLLKGNFP